MSSDVLKLLRYNTGNDKKVFIELKNKFNAVIFNATIVAHSGAAVADLVSVHQKQYIIDPQTHIFQHNIKALLSKTTNDDSNPKIKKSIAKYLDELPESLNSIITNDQRPLEPKDILPFIDELSKNVYKFETEYINKFIEEKEYDKYLEFANVRPEPNKIIAPYFMLKKEFSIEENENWLEINKECLKTFISNNSKNYTVAAQLVIEKDILKNKNLLEKIKDTYNIDGFEYLFVWIDDFSSFTANRELRGAFKNLLIAINSIGKKMVMAYGGYDSILLCNPDIKNRIYGVAQSVGYGESRSVTPVGGGFPVNKYYFLPLHQRLRFDEAARHLSMLGYFDKIKSNEEYANDYHKIICDCKQCHEIIDKNINNFKIYNESIPFIIKSRHGDIARYRPTTDATLITAKHFLYCKAQEWEDVNKKDLKDLITDLKSNYSKYVNDIGFESINEWCDIYAK